MSKHLFVNLPASDLKLAREFYTAIGFSVKEEYSNDLALAIYLDDLYFMLVSEKFFKEISKREIADTTKVCEAVNALGLESREEVDQFMAKVKQANPTWIQEPYEEEPGIYAGGFRDPFGHQFAVHYMDMG